MNLDSQIIYNIFVYIPYQFVPPPKSVKIAFVNTFVSFYLTIKTKGNTFVTYKSVC